MAGSSAARCAWLSSPSRRAGAPTRRSPPSCAAAADALANAGYEVVELTPPRYEEAIGTWARFLIGDFGSVLPQLLPLMGRDAQRFLDNASQAVPGFATPTAMSELMTLRDGIARAWTQFLVQTPLVLSPTWTQWPFEIGFDVATPQGTGETIEMMRPVLAGQPVGPAVGLRTSRPRRGHRPAVRRAADRRAHE